MASDPCTVGELLADGARRLAAASTSARLDAELLLAGTLQLGRTALYAHSERAVPAPARTRYLRLVAARGRGRPVAQLLGRREFWSLDLAVTGHTLVPRPETELLVHTALAWIDAGAGGEILDLGTGSGAIALAIARERPAARVTASDRCARALAVARGNGRRLGIGNARFLRSDWYTGLAGRRFDLIVSNPPYVARGDPALSRGALRFEPRLALDGGADGLDGLRAVIGGAPAHLRPGGGVLIEHGSTQGPAVRALLHAHGFAAVRGLRDLAGLDRASAAALPAPCAGA